MELSFCTTIWIFECFTLPHIVRPDMTGQHHSQNPNFLVNFSVIFRSFSGHCPVLFRLIFWPDNLSTGLSGRTVQWTWPERSVNKQRKAGQLLEIVTVIVINYKKTVDTWHSVTITILCRCCVVAPMILCFVQSTGWAAASFAAAYLTTNVTQCDISITLSQPTPQHGGSRRDSVLSPRYDFFLFSDCIKDNLPTG